MADAFKGLRLYNTLTRTKEEFVPIDPDNMRMYVCGPTVYDFAHIGNARPVIVFDVLYRLLRHLYGADHVTYVRNITDVDDKINARAQRDYPDLPLNEAIRKVTEQTNSQFQADVKALGCLEPDSQPRATEHITEMVAMIDRLVELGVAYVAEDHVLFSPSEMNRRKGPRYGSLSRRPFDEMLAGARVDVASYKRDEMDFVLWKPSKPGEPAWPSPAGIPTPGRPGWHIECSAMSMAKLLEPFGGGLRCDDPTKNTFDIHGGGIDLIFPHHENEIAQSCCALGTEMMARYWLHNGFLQVEGRKMAKSEGNFVTIRDILQTSMPALIGLGHSETHNEIRRRWNGLAARHSMLQTNYREPVDWTERRLLESSDELYRWYEMLREVHFDPSIETEAGEGIATALCDDLNTWQAITELRAAAKNGRHRDLGEGMKLLGLLDPFYIERDDIILFDRTAGVDKAGISQSVEHRLALIRDKNFAEADRIRAELAEQGIQLMDYKDPESGEKKTKWEVKR